MGPCCRLPRAFPSNSAFPTKPSQRTWTYAARWISWTLVAVSLSSTCQGTKSESEMHGPIFITEPPSHVDFSNFTGARIECVAHGNPPPVIRWTRADGSAVGDVAAVRQVLRNGTLVFLPFRGEDYKADIHAGIYKCSASNSVGTIVSRDVNIRAVVNQYFEVQVYDEFVILGNTAVLKCHIPSFVRDYVAVTSWVRVEETNKYSTVVPDRRFIQTPAGELYIQEVTNDDGSVNFRCETLHRLTGESRLSTPGKVVVTDPKSSVSPRITHSQTSTSAKQGDLVQLSCAAQGFPVPTYRWFRVKGRDLLPAAEGSRVRQKNSFLVIERVTAEDSGTYRCVVANSVGEERAETVLRVRVPLSAHVQPQQQVVDVGRPASFSCSASGLPVSLVAWHHNGRPLVTTSARVRLVTQWTLQISHVEKEDRGMYQCFVENGDETVQGTAELRLGDVLPGFSSTFSSETVQQGKWVSLKCSASGHPPPQISWTLDDLPLPTSRRFKTNEFLDPLSDVISFVNVSSVRVEDGGNYRCTASNKAGKVDYVARLNVFGPPHIRPIPNASTIAGSEAMLHCHVSGYPIDSIKWERDGNVLPYNHRQQVFENGTLLIQKLDRTSDEGSFSCVARGPQGETARRQVTVKVMVPPLIEPFAFPRAVQEGMRARLTCVVTQGDLPITIVWVKDGSRITADLDVTIRQDDDFSSSLTFARISTFQTGNYSCIAKNNVATTNYTASLIVDVPPRWTVQPSDTAVVFRASLLLDCKADGHPQPVITWKKAVGKESGKFRDINMTHAHHRIYPNGTLLLHSVSEQDEGYYLCEANNGVGGGLSKLVQLTVHAAAHFDQKFVNHTIRRGEVGKWACRARGDDPIEIHWLLNGQKVNNKDHPRLSWEERKLPDSLESKMKIQKVERHDAGTYSCVASNKYGKDETHIAIVVEESPEAPENVRVTNHASRSANLAWSAPFDGNNAIQRYVVQYKNTSGEWQESLPNRTVDREQTKITVDGLNPGWAYNFRVIAENSVGLGKPSASVGITTNEEAPNGSPLFVEARALGPEAVKVSWKPPRIEKRNGEITGYYIGHRMYESLEPYVYQPVDPTNGQVEEFVLKSLRKFTKYIVVVQAHNKAGIGPPSDEIVVFTSEDVPSGAPQNVACSAVDATSLVVTWEPPLATQQNGLIQGYKIFYQTLPELGGSLPTERFTIASGSTLRSTLFQLEKFTNYSIQVLAFTRMGDGVKCQPHYCRTLEDVPGPPGDIKALGMAADSILVSWSSPKEPNGILTKYNLYMRSVERGDQAKKLNFAANSPPWHEVRNLIENQRYEFWVTASTSVGEGQSTQVVTQSAKAKVPARIASFPLKSVSLWRSDAVLHCLAVGLPMPSREWRFRSQVITDNENYMVLGNGSLLIRNVRRADVGFYTCRVENIFGSDEMTQELVVFAPPLPPMVEVQQTSSTNIDLLLKPVQDDGNPLQGYIIKYKRSFGGWEEMEVKGRQEFVSLSALHCGTTYQVRVAAFNDIGIGEAGDMITVRTMGGEPEIPHQHTVLKINTTWVTIRLAGWPDGGCPIRHFVIQYRARHQRDFVLVSNNVPHRQENFVIPDLEPGITYHLHITAHNDAGSTMAEFDFVANAGNFAGNMQADSGEEPMPFYKDISIAVPMFSSLITLLVVAFAVCFFYSRRKYSRYQHSVTSSSQNDYPDIKVRDLPEKDRHPNNLIGCNYEPAYVPTPLRKTNQIVQQSEDQSAYPEKYFQNDVCPYATFRLPECKEDAETHTLQLRTFSDADTLRRYPARYQVDNNRADMQFIEKERSYMQRPLEEHLVGKGELPYLHQFASSEDIHMLKSSDTWGRGRYSTLVYDRDDQDVRYPTLSHLSGSSTQLFEQTQVPDLLYHGTDSNTSNESPEEKLRDYGLGIVKSSSPNTTKKPVRKYRLPSDCEIHGVAR